MRVLAVLNQKGGSLKTSMAVNLAAEVGARGHPTLVIDLDPQHSATNWLKTSPLPSELHRAFLEESFSLEDCVQPTDEPGVEIIPSSSAMSSLGPKLSDEPGAEVILREKMGALPSGRWKFCFLDCPPSLSLFSVSALVAAHDVLVPLEASAMALQGLSTLLRTIGRVRRRLNPILQLNGIVVGRVGRNNLSRDVISQLRESFGEKLYTSTVREGIRHREAPSYKQSMRRYDPSGYGARDYGDLALEFLKRGGDAK